MTAVGDALKRGYARHLYDFALRGLLAAEPPP